MVIDFTWETITLSVITQPICVVTKPNVIAKIRKYRELHEGHRFIPMIVEVHSAPMCDMDHFIKECAHLFHDKQPRGHLFLVFAFSFSSSVIILPFNVL